MTDERSNAMNRSQLRIMALSRWENEGGARAHRPHDVPFVNDTPSDHPPWSNAELVQLRVRVIALENVMIALLSQARAPQLQLVREMAAYISPRPGFTHHPLTIRAAAQMVSLVERAANYQATSEDGEFLVTATLSARSA
jgi:uncharacterized protein (DUF1778 family)